MNVLKLNATGLKIVQVVILCCVSSKTLMNEIKRIFEIYSVKESFFIMQ